MRKNKKHTLGDVRHSRKPSTVKEQFSRNSHPRLSFNPTPPKIIGRQTSSNLLSNPTSLEKKRYRPKVQKKGNKMRRKAEQPTQATIDTSAENRWKDHLKLTFRSRHQESKDISLQNSSLKCME